jgi:hypothetical protein
MIAAVTASVYGRQAELATGLRGYHAAANEQE